MVEQQQHHTAMSSLDTQALLTHHSHYCPSGQVGANVYQRTCQWRKPMPSGHQHTFNVL